MPVICGRHTACGLLKTAVNHSPHCVPFVFHARTPKALDNTAQGCEATLGPGSDVAHQPRRGCTLVPGTTPLGLGGTRCPPTQGVLRDPGLCCETASRLGGTELAHAFRGFMAVFSVVFLQPTRRVPQPADGTWRVFVLCGRHTASACYGGLVLLRLELADALLCVHAQNLRWPSTTISGRSESTVVLLLHCESGASRLSSSN